MGTKLWNYFEKTMKFFLIRILRLSFLESRWSAFMQFIKFGLVGLSNTLVSYVVYLIGIFFGLHYLAASILGFLVSVLNAFFWNNKYVFTVEEGETRSLWKSFCKTFVSYAGTSLILSNILLIIQVDVFQWPEVLAPLINLVITIPLNFVLNKVWAFRKNKKSEVKNES